MVSHQLQSLVAELHAEDIARGYRLAPREALPPAQLKLACQHMDAIALPIPASVTVRSDNIGGVDGLWFELSQAAGDLAILYFHGGGFMFGTPLNTGHMTARLASAAGVSAFSADYRLSWQAPFPAPVEDAVCAYRGLLDRGYASQAIALAGDSAGGGLVIATLLALRDAGHPMPAAAFATSPWTDLAHTGESIEANAQTDVVCTTRGLQIMAEGYLNGIDPKTPLASPLYGDLSGLPPLLIQTGANEQLRDDGVRLAEKAKAAGVDVTLDVVDGGVHLWQYIGPDLPETRLSEKNAGAFLARHLRAGSASKA